MSSTSGALEAIDRILNVGGDADDVLRDVVRTLHERAGYPWAGILFREDGGLVLGPSAGEPQPERRMQLPVQFNGEPVAELAVDSAPEEHRNFLERVAVLISAHCLVGWDTGGAAWTP
jgi:putative methionine-R-sulfoxide reductase with GAF domain